MRTLLSNVVLFYWVADITSHHHHSRGEVGKNGAKVRCRLPLSEFTSSESLYFSEKAAVLSGQPSGCYNPSHYNFNSYKQDPRLPTICLKLVTHRLASSVINEASNVYCVPLWNIESLSTFFLCVCL